MNERIRQLAEQAFFDENTNQPSDKMYTFTEHKMKQFAELIVQECANHCDLLLDHKISSEWARGTHDCSKAIKKHFGVE